MVTKPGLYDTSERDYHADPCPAPSLSSSVAKLLVERSPAHAWHAHPKLNPNHEEERDDKFDLGDAAHVLMLGSPQRFALVDAKDWKTNAAKEARQRAYDSDHVPLLEWRFAEVQKMVAAGRAQLAAHCDASDAFADGGKGEQTLIWREDNGVWCRCRLDWTPAKLHRTAVFYDYKTTSANAAPHAYGNVLFNTALDVQSAFYRRGIRKVLGVELPEFKFVVQECEAPFALCVMGLPPADLELADRKVERALDLWARCLSRNEWPGYPAETVYLQSPPYHETKWLEREATVAADPEAFERLNRWQAPAA